MEKQKRVETTNKYKMHGTKIKYFWFSNLETCT